LTPEISPIKRLQSSGYRRGRQMEEWTTQAIRRGEENDRIPTPDVELTWGRKLLLIASSVALLAVLGVLLAVAVGRLLLPPQSPVLARTVAARAMPIAAPVSGTWVPSPLNRPAGDLVGDQEVLGQIEPNAEHKALLARLASEIQAVRDAEARHRTLRAAPSHDLEQSWNVAQLWLQIVRLQAELDQLRELDNRRTILCPARGRLLGNVEPRAVKQGDILAEVWPEGGPLLIELRGRAEEVRSVQSGGGIVTLNTPCGSLDVEVAIPDAVQGFHKECDLGRYETWATATCIPMPTTMPPSVIPGLAGQLRRDSLLERLNKPLAVTTFLLVVVAFSRIVLGSRKRQRK